MQADNAVARELIAGYSRKGEEEEEAVRPAR